MRRQSSIDTMLLFLNTAKLSIDTLPEESCTSKNCHCHKNKFHSLSEDADVKEVEFNVISKYFAVNKSKRNSLKINMFQSFITV